MIATAIPMPCHISITKPHNDEHSALSLKGYVRSSLGQYVRSSLHCIKISRAMDPCAGSGHILDYLFDVLMQIYTDYGYTTSEAVRSIIENNLYGLDIDDRAAQLAYFSVMMKARSYDRRFLTRKDEDGNPDIPQPHVYAIVESNYLNQLDIEYFTNNDPKLKKDFGVLVDELHDAKEYGSILNITQVDFAALYARIDEVRSDISMYKEPTLKTILPLIQVAEALAQKYHVVVTNPPYMGSSSMGAKLSGFVKKNYPDSKSDLFSCFIEHGNYLTMKNGYNCMVTMQSWMFLSSFETMRTNILKSRNITNLMHMENMVLGIAFGTAVTVFQNGYVQGYKGTYNHIKLKDIENEEPKEFPVSGNRFAQVSTANFTKIPGSPVAYWVSKGILDAFIIGKPLGEIALSRNGMKTGDNNRFIRLWWEVNKDKCNFEANNYSDALSSCAKWFPYNKGGEYHKWYGNNDYIVNWEFEGQEIFSNPKADNRHVQDYPEELKFTPSGSWGLISSGQPSFRYKEHNLSDIAGMSFYASKNEVLYLISFCNTPISVQILQVLAPTINYQAGDIGRLPILGSSNEFPNIVALAEDNISLCKKDWDAFETSWDFTRHPFVPSAQNKREQESSQFRSSRMEKFGQISWHYDNWANECAERFAQLKSNEEELNRIFIDIYGLQEELTPDVEDKDVTVRLADKARDIRSFISYAVGCMFGRYSLDVDGLAYVGGEWDASKYSTYIPDKDGILPICDDEYFEDDIANRFVDFVRVVYGKDTLEENLKFIADALGGKDAPRQVIRDYFMNDFYADHLKVYQKRPIYWLFDSGRKNGFKCLIYIHRYKPDTIARIRTDYVHEQQARYRTAIAGLENQIANAGTGERVKLNKQLKKLQEQADELHGYEEKIHHLADQFIPIDLDDGVKNNYEIFKDVLAKIK